MSPSLARKLTLLGLFLGLAGVVILFLYGMPFHVPTNGIKCIAIESINKADVALEHRYTLLGWAGLGCLVVGTILQMIPVAPPGLLRLFSNRV